MARFQAGRGGNFDITEQWQLTFQPMEPDTEDATKAVFRDSLNNTVTMFGDGLDSSNPDKIKGTVDRVLVEDGEGRLIFEVTQFSIAYKKLYEPVQNDWEYAIENFMSVLMQGDDKHIGTNRSEEIPVGVDPGDDVIDCRGGDDLVRGGPGDNKIDGGAGIDTLLYHTYWWVEAPQTRGVDMDVAAGTVITPWKGTDTISGFEIFRLSLRNDEVKGSSKNETFELLDGKDTLDGRGGFDTVDYTKDSWYEGMSGVVVNLTTGRATDGFGKTDELTSIEGIVGTDKADRLTGNRQHNEIAGMGGKDRLEGGGGSDTFIFNFGFGRDTVVDFEASGRKHDIIRLVDYDDFKNFGDLEPLLKQVGKDVIINEGGSDEITLLNVDLGSLAGRHFEFET